MSVNRVTLLGNVGSVDIINNENKIAHVSIATTKKGYTAANGTNIPDRTEWHRVTMFRKLADVAEKYIQKGDKLYIEGELQYGSYEKEGVKHYTTSIVVEKLELLGGQRQNGNNQGGQPPVDFSAEKGDDLPF